MSHGHGHGGPFRSAPPHHASSSGCSSSSDMVVVAAAVALWPDKNTIPSHSPSIMPTASFGGNRGGHRHDADLGDCGSSSAGRVFRRAPQPPPPRLPVPAKVSSISNPGRMPERRHCSRSFRAPVSRNFAWVTTFAWCVRPTRTETRSTPSKTIRVGSRCVDRHRVRRRYHRSRTVERAAALVGLVDRLRRSTSGFSYPLCSTASLDSVALVAGAVFCTRFSIWRTGSHSRPVLLCLAPCRHGARRGSLLPLH